ncbi:MULTISPECIES: putative quinol monooxygenase [Chitinophagaceae]
MVSTQNKKLQPGYVIKMVAKSGKIDLLRKRATDGMRIANENGNWVHCIVETEPDTLWTFEFFESEEAKKEYEESDLAAQLRGEILDLIEEPLHSNVMRIPVTPFSASWLPIPYNS